jgi:hypothetical protein
MGWETRRVERALRIEKQRGHMWVGAIVHFKKGHANSRAPSFHLVKQALFHIFPCLLKSLKFSS